MEAAIQNWQFISEVELIYKTKIKASERPQIKSSKDTYKLVISTWDTGKIEFFEQFKILLLNHSFKVLGICEISSGGISGTIVDLRLIFSAALKANATNIIMIHNHPSGNTRTSQADIYTTKKVKQAGEILDIKLLDHQIVTAESYYYFVDDGCPVAPFSFL